MSFYIDNDDDPLHKTEVELLCGLCTMRFKKFKVDIKNLSFFDESLIKKRSLRGILDCSSCRSVGGLCSSCTEEKRKLDLADRPYKCPFCDMLFAHSLHLLKHKLRHKDQESGRDVAQENFCSGCSEDASQLDLADRPYKCPICHKLFAHSLHLLKHELRHKDHESGRIVAEEEDNVAPTRIYPIS